MVDRKPTKTSTISRQLFALAAPIMGINLLNVATLAVDYVMCGALENSQVVLTALGFASQLVFLLMVAMMGLTVGTVALVSRAHGAGERDRQDHIIMQSLQLTCLLSAVVAVVGNLAADPLLQALGASGENLYEAKRYLRPLLGATVFYYLMILFGGILRGVGNTRLPFVVAVITNILNIGLNYVFILGKFGAPELGVQGAALGSVIAYAANVTITVIVLRRGAVTGLWIPLRPRRIDVGLAKLFFYIGGLAALDMLILNAAFLSILGMLGRISDDAVAAHGIGLRIQALAFVPGLGVSQATAALVGKYLGAGDIQGARVVARASMVLSAVIMTVLACTIVMSSYAIVGAFNVQPGSELEAFSVEWIRLLGYCMPVVGINIALVGVFQGAGATGLSLRIGIIGTLLFQIPMSYILGFPMELGAFGVWLAFPLSFVVKVALSTGFYRRGRWAKTGATL